MKRITAEDKRKVAEYRRTLGKYEKPSVTADIVAVRPAFSELREDQWRENPKFAMELLLIKRGQWPHAGCWALPGGFIGPDESVEEGARRELREETSLEAHPLIPVGVFSKPGRDMRAWIISNAFVSVYRRGEGCNAKGGDDAAAAKWFRIEGPRMSDGKFRLPFYENGASKRPAFVLTGRCTRDGLGCGRVDSVDDNPLAFDHAEIIAQAFLRMLSFDLEKLVFLFLPEKFTLSNYIDIYQYVTGGSIAPNNVPNFRRRLLSERHPVLEECEGEYEDAQGKGHARAKLYRALNAK